MILKESNETFTFIGSGTQILPFDRFLTEAWYQYSRQRLFDLIGKYKKSGVIFLSGDIHSAEILRTPCVLPGLLISLFLKYEFFNEKMLSFFACLNLKYTFFSCCYVIKNIYCR